MESLTKKLNIDLNRAAEELNKNGITFKETESLALIAKNHGTSPVRIYGLIKQFERDAAIVPIVAGQDLKVQNMPAAPPLAGKAQPLPQASSARPTKIYTEELVEERFEGRGAGRKTLASICEENGLDLAVARKKLAARQIVMKDSETLKEAAERYTTASIELLKIIMVGEPVNDIDRGR